MRLKVTGRGFQIVRVAFRADCEQGHWVETSYYTVGRTGRTAIGRDGSFEHSIDGQAPATIRGAFRRGPGYPPGRPRPVSTA